jgi:hypothetical protein
MYAKPYLPDLGESSNTYRPYVRISSREAAIPSKPKRTRSTLSPDDARKHYVEIGEIATLEQIRTDAKALDDLAIAIGPFARLDAGAVAAREKKTRGSITNLFGSQSAFQVETMKLALSAGAWIDQIRYPAPADFPTAEAWIGALFAAESARGPQHGAKPILNYAALWALWLSALPYGLWSKRVAKPSVEEYGRWMKALEQVYAGALDHFGLKLRRGVTLHDLAAGTGALVEGTWLNQCVGQSHPGSSQPLSTALARSGLLLWRGATEPA